MMRKGQVSSELLVVIAFVLLLFIPLLFTAYLRSIEANEQLATLQATILSSRLAFLVNSIGYMGGNSSIITEVYLPPNAVLNTTGKEIILKVRTQSGTSDIVQVTKFPINKIELTQSGIYMIEISAQDGRVQLKKWS